MGTNCAPLVADLFLFCYERGYMLSLSAKIQADVVAALNSTSMYLIIMLNIYNYYIEKMVSQIYSPEFQLNNANSFYTKSHSCP